MIRLIKNMYHFLGSVRCAVILILTTALFVIFGTLLESSTGSHRYAAQWTYSHVVFQLLLSLFFVNILFAALRRWPFRWRHVPFLLTHLGLLMILAGVIIKNGYGVQGTMAVVEGSYSDEVFFSNTYALQLEAKDPEHPYKKKSVSMPLDLHHRGLLEKHEGFPDVALLESTPHAELKWEMGQYFGKAVIVGLPPFSFDQWQQIKIGGVTRNLLATKKEAPPLRDSAVHLSWDAVGNVTVAAATKEGEVASRSYVGNTLQSIAVYDQGFSGYAVPVEIPEAAISLELPLSFSLIPKTPGKKLEDNVPGVMLKFNNKERAVLSYDPQGTGLAWPILGGNYLARFQPRFEKIPYKVRLRDARKINYPGTGQPYSFESDLIVTDLRTGKVEEATISMNHVYETWDGYRFYLANIAPGDDTAVQRAHIIVNVDPAKYLLTYPGAFILSLGIILLFWWGKSDHTARDPLS